MNRIIPYNIFESQVSKEKKELEDDINDIFNLTIRDNGFKMELSFCYPSTFVINKKTFNKIYLSITIYQEYFKEFRFDDIEDFYTRLSNYLKSSEFEIVYDNFPNYYITSKKDEYLILIKKVSN